MFLPKRSTIFRCLLHFPVASLMSLVCILLASCGAEPNPYPCEVYATKSYYHADELYRVEAEGGYAYRHKKITLTKTSAIIDLNGTSESGPLDCSQKSDNEILVTTQNGNHYSLKVQGTFDLTLTNLADRSTLEMRYESGAESVKAKENCSYIQRQKYDVSGVFPLEGNEDLTQSTLDFSEGNNVLVDLSAGLTRGMWDCELGDLHIHRDEFDTQPMIGTFIKSTGELLVKHAGADLVFDISNSQVCDQELAPVCAAIKNTQPCDALPCPSVTHKTYSNACSASSADLKSVLFNGDCGDLEGTPVYNLGLTCPYSPSDVHNEHCGKVVTLGDCDGQPCLIAELKEFKNQCAGDSALASPINRGYCPANPTTTNALPPAEFVWELKWVPILKDVTINNPRIDQHILTVDLSYQACAPVHFNLYVQKPDIDYDDSTITHQIAFQAARQDNCSTPQSHQAQYDLQPVKYGIGNPGSGRANWNNPGVAHLTGLGDYHFQED